MAISSNHNIIITLLFYVPNPSGKIDKLDDSKKSIVHFLNVIGIEGLIAFLKDIRIRVTFLCFSFDQRKIDHFFNRQTDDRAILRISHADQREA